MAFAAIVLNRESIFALVMANTAGFASLHVGHAGLDCAGLEREHFRVTIGAFIGLGMELVAECGFPGRCFEGDLARLHAFVALVAVSG